ncbi:DUF1194 domain-containing protein [Jhaorihella thermophila]|uniref:DUF1194 domain-containing protein n=1 Tax=Jhaorihella thermophila TaxID=488547 RepID=UPI00361E9FDB
MIRAALLALCLVPPLPAAAACRHALALGLDVSGSVDGREYRLQLDGLAAALRDPRVKQALLAMPAAPVRIAVFEWSGPAINAPLQNGPNCAAQPQSTALPRGCKPPPAPRPRRAPHWGPQWPLAPTC